ncbi:hypothetical protein HET69_31800 [Streptomyces sp. CJ_13]|uniref:hypothetical protein n=1 Tax=Streptomyces sp. CJ_13 TaxID=2724943 RepID=UPI001BDD92CD|nr:hypothetical protein [Streptomyces sp. CJ_13]MBT1188437.1 hypothetical protein [Streptomyces sp. CJ_13]
MPTTVVGFRLGNAVTSRQVTVLVTETGVLHRAHGGYGQPPKLDPPKLPLRYLHPDLAWMKGEHMLTGPISALRDHHATATKKGYTQVLIAPACVRLDLEEHPPPPKENPHDARPHPELTEAFIRTAPDTAQPLAAAVDEFRAALGLPVRQKHLTWRARQAPVPPRIEAMLRTLTHGSTIASPERLTVGWSVTPQAVTLRIGRTAEPLDRPAVLELQAALTAWLRLTQPPTS